jgi:tRNA U38,U39,U40 pseudouridine synthase TruA
VYVGLGKIHPEDLPRILAARTAKRGAHAPADGLVLVRVFYDRKPVKRPSEDALGDE